MAETNRGYQRLPICLCDRTDHVSSYLEISVEAVVPGTRTDSPIDACMPNSSNEFSGYEGIISTREKRSFSAMSSGPGNTSYRNSRPSSFRWWCRRGESNPRPRDYETLALPLSYAGRQTSRDPSIAPESVKA
jgi:hypothetical protein